MKQRHKRKRGEKARAHLEKDLLQKSTRSLEDHALTRFCELRFTHMSSLAKNWKQTGSDILRLRCS
jgi:hypothetical protein